MNDDSKDSRPEWSCFSCGKHLGKQGSGGDFQLDFGYGSSFDYISGISGWICDECVAQKHTRLMVKDESGDLWEIDNDTFFKSIISSYNFYGMKELNFNSDLTNTAIGLKGYDSITAKDRSDIESSLLNNCPINPDIVIRLLQALHESEAARARADERRHESEINSFDRMRQQAGRLSDSELARLRERESKLWDPEDIVKLVEHYEATDRIFYKMEEEISSLKKLLMQERLKNGIRDSD